MRILFVGDIYGEPGRDYLFENLERIKKENKINLVMANAENVAGGKGINQKIYKELMSHGISVLTMGNHTFSNKEINEFLSDSKIVIPANYPNRPKNGYITIKYNDVTITVINLLGRIYMNNMPLDCPFKVAKEIVENVKSDYYIIDFHGEATSEKIAFGNYMDGIKGAILGTHTHVPTCDERELPNKTLYITDIGMTGPYEGVIGVDKDIIIEKFVEGKIGMHKVAKGKRQFNAVVLDFDTNKIFRINFNE